MRPLVAVSCILVFLTAAVGSPAAGGKFDPSLRFLADHRAAPLLAGMAGRPFLAAGAGESVVVTAKFDHVLSGAEIEALRADGVRFFEAGGDIARTGAIYPLRVPWEALDGLAARRELLRVEAAWNPVVLPLLDVSAVEIEAAAARGYDDPLGAPIAGSGMRIADFDTGIDVFHPSFFRADGDTLDWIDADESGDFTAGTDAVDLDGDGFADAGETLDFLDGWIYDPAHVWGAGYPSNDDGVCQTWWDWLYNDANGNGEREYGPGDGFAESDPTYGELLFIALDDDADGELDPGERLVALGTSKVRATANADQVERERGVDLIMNENDTNGHGTAVSGILAGGWPGRHRFTGVAPDAEILAGYFFSGLPISYLVPWARSREADAMLYEFGGFVWEPLDGSTLDAEIISIENETIVQVTPSGNLARGGKHAISNVPANDSTTVRIGVPQYNGQDIGYLYGTVLWRTAIDDLVFRMETPLGGRFTFEPGLYEFDGYYFWFDWYESDRGTMEFDFYVAYNNNPNVLGTWELTIVNETAGEIETIENVADNLSSWAGGAEWLDDVSNDRNVTWPATADSAFCNASYSTRGFEGYGGVGAGSIPPGEISAFSGRGARIDGKHLLDIASPGNYDVYSTRTSQDTGGYPLGGYRQFSGTSAAGPHVAAAVALVKQSDTTLTADGIQGRIAAAALADGFTGAVYNDTWGWGKLRILDALGVAVAVGEIERGDRPPRLVLDANWPNPFNPVTWIPFYIPADGRASIRIYDVRGRLVRVLRERRYEAGAHSVMWDGRDEAGREAVSGVYFCVLRAGDETRSRKLVLLR
ncbi:MAG: S8 family serine peptidase [Candidatus Krumholzibacteriota bacterium]|nr:S8 family serine peptidase [Candidatus Krumholzibacteriota bacterium]